MTPPSTRPPRGLVARGAGRRVTIALTTAVLLVVASETTAPPLPVVTAGEAAAPAVPTASAPVPDRQTTQVTPAADPGVVGAVLGVPSLPTAPVLGSAGQPSGVSDTPPTTTSGSDGAPDDPASQSPDPDGDAGADVAGAMEAALPSTPALLDQPDPAIALGVARAAATTGVPDGVVLTPMTGEIRVRTPGQVIDGIDLTGCLIIEASNVVVRNSRVSCRNPTKPSAVHVVAGNWNLLIEDSEIDGLGGADIGVGWNNYTLRRVEIRNVADGAKAGSNVTIEDSWIHDIIRKGDLHPDAIQSTGGRDIVIRRNYLDPVPMGATDVRNSAIQLGSENGDGLSNVLIESNILVGGNYTVNVRGDTVVQNVVFRGNTFNGPRRYGPIQAPPSVVFEDNIDLVTGGTTTQVRLVYS